MNRDVEWRVNGDATLGARNVEQLGLMEESVPYLIHVQIIRNSYLAVVEAIVDRGELSLKC